MFFDSTKMVIWGQDCKNCHLWLCYFSLISTDCCFIFGGPGFECQHTDWLFCGSTQLLLPADLSICEPQCLGFWPFIIISVPLFWPFMSGSEEYGWRHMAGKSVSLTVLLFCRPPSAQSRLTQWGWLLSCFMEWHLFGHSTYCICTSEQYIYFVETRLPCFWWFLRLCYILIKCTLYYSNKISVSSWKCVQTLVVVLLALRYHTLQG